MPPRPIPESAIPGLTELLDTFGGEGGDWACMWWEGRMRIFDCPQSKARRVSRDREVFAYNLCSVLQKHEHHDGHWLVGWADWRDPPLEVAGPVAHFPIGDYSRLLMCFIDADGDMQFMVDSIDPWQKMAAAIDDYVEQCSVAWNEWREHLKVSEIRPEDTIKAAQGQAPTDPLASLAIPHLPD